MTYPGFDFYQLNARLADAQRELRAQVRSYIGDE